MTHKHTAFFNCNAAFADVHIGNPVNNQDKVILNLLVLYQFIQISVLGIVLINSKYTKFC